jgi:glutamine synthetase
MANCTYVPNGKELSKDEIKSLIVENNIKFIRLQFVDINGHVKNMAVPADRIDSVLDNEIMLDGSSIKGFRSIETSDMYFYPDRTTFAILPWRGKETSNVARLICDIYNPDGTPFEGCPRTNLKRVLEEAKKLGYTINFGPEAEFFLFKKDENGKPVAVTHDAAGYYDLGPDDLGEDLRAEMVHTLQKMGFEIEASHHEVAEGQHEIDFKYSDALTTADNVVTFRVAVKSIAAKYGLHATFMPKPIFGVNGSGMHCNFSLMKDGKNAFLDESKPYQLSQEALWAIGGVLKNVRGIAAVTNPTVNSYKRLVPGYEAPVYLAWSAANRSALLRVPAKRGPGTRVELRSPDPSCNPYLAFAAILTAALDGIKNQIDPPAPAETNIYHLTEKERKKMKIDSLPGSLEEAVELLEKSAVAKEALGEHIYGEFVSAKKREWDSYRTAVSQWELDTYLEQY